MALVVVIKDAARLEPTLRDLRDLFAGRISPKAVELVAEITPDGEALLYIRRGPGWKQRRGNGADDDD
jgi:hypothetical protein